MKETWPLVLFTSEGGWAELPEPDFSEVGGVYDHPVSSWPYGLAEDDITAILQAEVRGDGGGAVLHEQEDHGCLGLVAHHGHTVCEGGQQRVKSLAPLTCT